MVLKKDITNIFELILKKYENTYKCTPDYETFNYTTVKGEPVSIEVEKMTKRPDFQKAVAKVVDDYIKKGFENKIWRVDVPDLDWIKDAQLYRTKNGSTLAIRPDGDIVAVAGKLGDDGYPLDNSEALLAYAVSKGGNKLDSFDGNWRFYRKCGFIPRTYLDFDKDFAPDGWKEGRDLEEKVIFMEYANDKKYLDGNDVIKEMSDFYDKNNPITEKDMVEGDEYPWDAGYRIRDEMME